VSTRRIVLLPALILAAALALLAGCGDDSGSSEPEESLTPTAVAGGAYELELPSNWSQADEELTEQLDTAADPAVDEMLGEGVGEQLDATQIFFRGDPEAAFRTNLNIIAEPLPASIPFEDAVTEGTELIEERLPEGQILSGPESTDLAGEEAYEVRYTAAQAGETLQFALVQALHDGVVYSITLTSNDEEFEEARAEFQQILDSWDWS
jgi:hypothetical protein